MAKPFANILVIGSSNTDMILNVDRIPKPGETILGGQFTTAAGGKGANQAVAAARAGGTVTFVARIGKDMFGDRALAGFAAEGLNVDYVVRDGRSPSGIALIFVRRDGENSIAVASGANARLSSADVRRARRMFRSSSVLLLQLETPLETVATSATLASACAMRVILNPAPARTLPANLLRRATILTPNEHEAELLTGIRVRNAAAACKAADRLLQRGVQNVIVTLGSRGVFVAGPSIRELIPGHKVEPVDTTGAGDVFNGALAVAIAEGRPLLDAARFANAAAALSVTRLGAQPSAPRRKAIEHLCRLADSSSFSSSSSPLKSEISDLRSPAGAPVSNRL